jgi:hypothetical protein
VTAIRSATQLQSVEAPAWPWVLEVVARAAVTVEVLPVAQQAGERTLFRLQVTTASPLGAIARHCGALVFDHGWLRVLGGGTEGLHDVATWNGLDDREPREPPAWLVIACDVLGGRFALNGGGLPGEPGEVAFFPPDTLEWEPTGLGYSAFIQWASTLRLGEFYRDWRWPRWEDEVAALPVSHGLSTYPPMFTAEGRDVLAVARKAVPLVELVRMLDDVAPQVRQLPDGNPFVLRSDD